MTEKLIYTDCNIWLDLLKLSEQLSAQNSLLEQRDLILSAVERLIGGHAALWLSHAAFHLPGMTSSPELFNPTDPFINQVIETQRYLQKETLTGPAHNLVGVPLIVQKELIGVLTVERMGESLFSEDEVHFLESLSFPFSRILACQPTNSN